MEADVTYEEYMQQARSQMRRDKDAFEGRTELDWWEIGNRGQFVPLEKPDEPESPLFTKDSVMLVTVRQADGTQAVEHWRYGLTEFYTGDVAGA